MRKRKLPMLNLPKDRKYLLACSFGPDSMALFSMLINEGYNFDVAHVNYHYRKESDEEERKLREFCELQNVKIRVHDNKDLSTSNLEAKARNIRYNFFSMIYSFYHYDGLLIAHNLDDLIETYYIQKNTEVYTLFYGLKRFSTYLKMKVYRPLLEYSKDELLDYCDQNNIPYAIDESNFDKKHLRNQIRHDIVSKMSKGQKLELYDRIQEENARNQAIKSFVLVSGDINSASYLSSLTSDEFNHAIHELAYREGIYLLSKGNIEELFKIVASKKANILLTYKDYYFIKEYDNVRFVTTDIAHKYSYVLDKPGVLDTPFFYLDFTKDSSNRNVYPEDYPLTIRNADTKHKIKVKDYMVPVGRLFIDWKMPLLLRKRWPIILDKNNKPIYIPRYQKDFKKSDKDNFYVK